ncbi:MAG: DUF87 domain-containing protein [Sphingomonas sp.]
MVRTAQILDLPLVTPTSAEGLTGFETIFSTFSQLANRPGMAASRHFPEFMLGPQQAMDHRLCLPFLGSLSGWRTEMRLLFEQMLANSPAIISITLRPITEGEVEKCRVIAAYWKAMASQFLAQFANSGFADAASLARTFDRFTMPARYLTQASIKCAARSNEIATSMASMLAACLGGPAAFEVVSPEQPGPVWSLSSMAEDYPVPGVDNADVLREEQSERLASHNVAIPTDETALDFLIRASHIYTLDEVHAISQLPVADDDGLPGLTTRMPAPFAAPWPRPSDADNPFRIGVVQRRQGDPLAEATGKVAPHQWHRMPLEALTKHALVVGSTGSGKTLTTLFLARELQSNKIPFLVIEPVKTEYYQRLSDCMPRQVTRWRFEGDRDGNKVEDFFAYDPFTLQKGVSVARHASYLKSCFLAAFPLPPVEALLLEAGLRDYYTAPGAQLGCGLALFTRGTANTTVQRDDPQVDPSGGRVLEKDGKTVREERMLHPSMKGFFKYFNTVFLRRKVLGSNARRGSDPRAAALVTQLKAMFGDVSGDPARATAFARELDRLKRMLSTDATGGNARLAETLMLWQQMFARRFESIQSGPIGLAADEAAAIFARTGAMPDFQSMLQTNTVIELDGIPDEEQKSLMMAFVLTALFERRQADDLAEREKPRGERPAAHRGPRHVMIVEEAHRVLSSSGSARSGEVAGMDAKSKSVSLFVDMLAEIRAFGQGIIIVEQIPTKIVSEAIKNTNLKIMLRLTSRDDREYLGEAMNFTETQKRFVTTLRAERGKGINMVVFEEGVEQPVMLSLPFNPTGESWVFDDLF